MAVVEITAFLVVVGKVAVLSVAIVKVDTVLEDVNVKVAVLVAGIKVAPALEGVVVKVAFFPKVVVMIGRLHWYIRLLGQPVVEGWIER